ncbi:ABC transporter permease, partial [mine drainage metagenome]
DEYLGFGPVVRALHSDNQKELPHTVIVTEALAERLWPGQPALGKTFYMGNGIQFRVIGVITNLLRPEVPSIGADYSILFPIRISMQQAAGY